MIRDFQAYYPMLRYGKTEVRYQTNIGARHHFRLEGGNGDRRFFFDATNTSKEYLVEETKQGDCPMFYQSMCLLYGDGFHAELECDKLKDALIYIDFSGTFDRRRNTGGPDAVAKAEAILSPEGVTIDFGKGGNKYVAFERSASMIRNNILSFIREDLYEPLRKRIMLGMTVGNCQLAKLYAYNGLMYTSGRRYEDAGFLSEKKIVVIDNPKSIVKDAHIITVVDDGSDDREREYRRVEKTADVEVLEFDGEGSYQRSLRTLSIRLPARTTLFRYAFRISRGVCTKSTSEASFPRSEYRNSRHPHRT